ncbi:SphA family protein [Oryzibacter oryziterrae]|uniref:SphA family protein n=1 Tax=Oryzibacter oryziterrae TaxID=2766474 RepID=UPI001F2CB107|nr:transporter [Oryzibacter oryziterrae]
MNKSLYAAAALTVLGLVPATAAENGNTQYAPGASQFFAGAVPPYEGLYFLSQSSYYTSSRLNDGNGREIPIDFNVNVGAETLRFLYVSPIKIGGAQVWGQVVLPLLNLDLSTAFASDRKLGLADATITGGLAWHPDPFQSFVLGLDVALPTGSYHAGDLANTGLNHWSVQPTVGYHYFDPQGLDLGAAARLIFNSENEATNYRSGTELVVDYAFGWNFDQVKVGATGYFLKQLSDDHGPGVAADGHRGEGLAIGPSLTYSFNPGTQISASWQHDVLAENRSQGDAIWVNFATSF